MTLKSKFLGCILGVGIGDSLGRRWEGSFGPAMEEIERGSQVLRYTDDTHMTLGVLESLIACKGLDIGHMAHTFVKNYEEEPYRGYGPGPPRIFRLIRRGEGLLNLDRGIYPGGSYGNGSAMRIAPVGLLYHDSEELRGKACSASEITHSHELGKEGAALQAYAVALAVKISRLDVDEFLDELEKFAENSTYKKKLRAMRTLDREKRSEVTTKLGNGIEAFNSVPAAVFSFLTAKSFSDAVLYAISLGGDTDTIGAMTGAIAGAYYGIEGIPPEWIDRLENGRYLERLALELLRIGES